MSRDYGIRPWEMVDVSRDEYAAIVDDVKARDAAARKAARGG